MALGVYNLVILSTFVLSGSINTLSTKWADESEACGLSESCGPQTHKKFDHPFLQACGMFLGEFLCFIVYWIWRRCSEEGRDSLMVPPKKWFLFIIPAMCDLISTSSLYIALNLTYASSFQMLRVSITALAQCAVAMSDFRDTRTLCCSVCIFTGLLSVAFLGRTILPYMWVGIGTLTVGLVVIGLADTIFNNDTSIDANGIISGDLLIIMSQIISAIQFVYEEKFIKKHNFYPLLVVGLEGMFGFIILVILLIPMYHIPASSPFTSPEAEGHLENVFDAFAQMRQNWQIILASVGNILSIAVFNFCGITITKELSATTRQVLDGGRVIIIWAVSLGVGWQPFDYRSILVQLVGFLLLLSGMMIYNNLVFRPLLIRHHCMTETHPSEHGNPLINQQGDDESVSVDDDNDERLIVP